MNTILKPTYLAATLAIILGVLLSFWPLEAIAVLVLIVGGRFPEGITLALLLDIIYGAPPGLLGSIYLPFTFGALVISLLVQFAEHFMVDRRSQRVLF